MNDTKKIHPVYPLFSDFIETCLIGNDSLLTEESNIMSKDNLMKVKETFTDGTLAGSGKNYWEKIEHQFKDAKYEVKLCFVHLNWLWSLSANDINYQTKIDTPKLILGGVYKGKKDKIDKSKFSESGVGSAGQYHKTNKAYEIDYLLILCLMIKDKNFKTLEEANTFIIEKAESVFRKNSYKITEEVYEALKVKSYAMKNLIMHLAKPEDYEPIASNQDKKSILLNFRSLLSEIESSMDLTIDEEIKLIKKELKRFNIDESFYSSKLKPIWQDNLKYMPEETLALQYKKALIYYGPPGTGKTFTAKSLAKSFIITHFLNKKENVKKYLGSMQDITKARVHHLQFNANTTYDDFIAGYQLVSTPDGSKTKATEGQLFEFINKAKSEQETTDVDGQVKLPHVLILDEINRVDLSRVFGELLSALEYRNEPINTSSLGSETLIVH